MAVHIAPVGVVICARYRVAPGGEVTRARELFRFDRPQRTAVIQTRQVFSETIGDPQSAGWLEQDRMQRDARSLIFGWSDRMLRELLPRAATYLSPLLPLDAASETLELEGSTWVGTIAGTTPVIEVVALNASSLPADTPASPTPALTFRHERDERQMNCDRERLRADARFDQVTDAVADLLDRSIFDAIEARELPSFEWPARRAAA